ncbi:MAG: hypothetical protein B6D59_03415 [Campylobacteraceae bacterium 4484_4]|nr:MAG: hypothetical protein B6D59_03415 [Campylobacteraceae bacterium 4484_4]
MEKEIVIIGAGASGLMAAARYRERDIALIEGNGEIGAKIRISGGGRCNITNSVLAPKHYLGDRRFIGMILKRFDQKALLAFLKERGLRPRLQKKHQYFCPHSSRELLELLQKEIQGVPLFLNRRVRSIEKAKSGFIIRSDRENFIAKKVVLATGGLSFPKMGATDLAFVTAKHFGIEVKPTAPALVGLTLQRTEFWMKELSGISLAVMVEVGDRKIEDQLLFAHRGISGPAILDASLYWSRGEIMIDFLPHLSHEQIKKVSGSKKQISTILGVPRRFVKVWLQNVGIKDRPMYRCSKEEIEKILSLKSYRFAPAGSFGYTKAEVTKGGVATAEIDPESMEAKKVPGLYFLGEALDVTGRLGGYNFQWAFSSAVALQL